MNGLQRVANAHQGIESDRVPTAPLFCGASRRVYGATYAEWALDPEIRYDSWIQGMEFGGFDGSATLCDLSVECADFGQEMVYPLEDTPHPNYNNPLVKSPDDYEKIEPIEWDQMKDGRMLNNIKFHEMFMNKVGQEHAVYGFVYGPLGVLSMMRGAENLFRECMKHKEQVQLALRAITDVLIDYTKAMMKTGVHGICLDTLFASSCIMSKRMWTSIEGPFAKEIADVVHANGTFMAYHNCGDGVYHDAQKETMNVHAASIACLPPDCEDWPTAKKKYFGPESENPTCLFGYMAPAANLFLGTPDMIKEEAKNEIADLAEGGYYVLAPGCEFPPNASLMNLLAFVESADLYGQYPINR